MRTIEHMRQLMSDSTGYCWAGVVGIGDGGKRKRDYYYHGRCISHSHAVSYKTSRCAAIRPGPTLYTEQNSTLRPWIYTGQYVS